ncbi:C40 family peptidase [Clostridium sp. YIM B02505]|uniref:C40 family peptidase n=2 Tax=Clostridium yunnanense TaxID=2800325 RepID=A0ABS1EPQ7_9CLOT|nr:C40 family peptidase [Clostridium yunnanense]
MRGENIMRKGLKIIAAGFFCSTLAFGLASSREAKADTTAKSEQGIVLKTAQLKSNNKTIISPKSEDSSDSKSKSKSTGSSKSNGSTKASRGGTSTAGGGAVSIAYQYLGRPYVFGAAGPRAFDCSGLTQYVYAKLGVGLPHYTGAQYAMGSSVSKGNLSPGDLVFFNTYGPISHVGIYIGGGDFIHAPSSGKNVTVSSLSESYYASRYAGARRIKN